MEENTTSSIPRLNWTWYGSQTAQVRDKSKIHCDLLLAQQRFSNTCTSERQREFIRSKQASNFTLFWTH